MWDPQRYCNLGEPITFFELMIRERKMKKTKRFPTGREIVLGLKKFEEVTTHICHMISKKKSLLRKETM